MVYVGFSKFVVRVDGGKKKERKKERNQERCKKKQKGRKEGRKHEKGKGREKEMNMGKRKIVMRNLSARERV